MKTAEASSVVRLYNKARPSCFACLILTHHQLAKALVTFEALWFNQWKSRLAANKSALQATLLVQHPTTKALLVNLDPNLMAAIEEAKVSFCV